MTVSKFAIAASPFGLALLCLWIAGCSQQQSSGVTVFVSGDTAGWITPCGCAANQSGGLARRSTLIQRTDPDQPKLLLDTGGTANGVSNYQQLKLESILRGMQQMGLHAHNIGQSESALGGRVLQQVSKQSGVPWIATNLRSIDTDWQPETLLQITLGGVKIVVLGVIDPQLVEHPGWNTLDPVASIVEAMHEVDADVRILLAYMDQAELQALATALPEIQIVVGGPTGQAMSPVKVGSVTVMSATNKGKFLAQFRIGDDDQDRFQIFDAKLSEVASSIEEDPQQLANLADYYDRLAEQDFPADDTGLVSALSLGRKEFSVAGSETCQACHQQDQHVWHASKHAHAWDALVAKSAHYDPLCQQCHSTGYGLENGFENVAQSSNRVDVGCENCHGPSLSHVHQPRIKTPWKASEKCIHCHDHENSPEFNANTYWQKILHGAQHTSPLDPHRTEAEVEL